MTKDDGFCNPNCNCVESDGSLSLSLKNQLPRDYNKRCEEAEENEYCDPEGGAKGTEDNMKYMHTCCSWSCGSHGDEFFREEAEGGREFSSLGASENFDKDEGEEATSAPWACETQRDQGSTCWGDDAE